MSAMSRSSRDHADIARSRGHCPQSVAANCERDRRTDHSLVFACGVETGWAAGMAALPIARSGHGGLYARTAAANAVGLSRIKSQSVE